MCFFVFPCVLPVFWLLSGIFVLFSIYMDRDFFLSPYTASRPHGHSRQVGAVVLKEGKYTQKNKERIVRG